MNQATKNTPNQTPAEKKNHNSGPPQRREPRPPAANVPSQAQIYDNLRRIGELEDKKKAIQNEIDSRTSKLRGAMAHIADDSLLYKMLMSALGKPAATSAAPAPKAAARKSTKRKSSTKRSTKKSTTKKKSTRKTAKKK